MQQGITGLEPRKPCLLTLQGGLHIVGPRGLERRAPWEQSVESVLWQTVRCCMSPGISSSIPRPSTSPSFSLRQMTEEEEETYKIACCEAGVWAQVEEHMAAAVE